MNFLTLMHHDAYLIHTPFDNMSNLCVKVCATSMGPYVIGRTYDTLFPAIQKIAVNAG